ncbi:hypothetical protein DFS33DRAFT_1273198 [Desarmillaria ectypa]|nr:hypothetical protein DFS33DRAFT_1273198 [Desarmillaria ectypa]
MSFSEHRVIPPPPQKQGEHSATFLPPPIDGSFTLQQMYDWHLQHSPTHRIFVYVGEESPRDRYFVNIRYYYLRYYDDGSSACQLRCVSVSLRNSAPDVARLLHEVGVEHVLVGRGASMQVLSHEALDILGSQYPSADLQQLSPIPVFEDLFLLDWQNHTNADDLPLLSIDPSTASFYLHSSGSTAYPKPINLNCHRLVEHTLVPWFGGRDLCESSLLCTAYPCIMALSREPEYIDWLSTRSGVLYGRGPLNKEAGDHLTSRGVFIFVLYGTDCWDYFEFTKLATPRMVANGPDLFEFVAAFSEPSIVNTNVDGVDSFATSDIFIPHLTKPGHWKIIGRIDDQIMHNTGEKVGVLVEPEPQFSFDPVDECKLAEFRNMVWPTVKKMSQFAPQHSRLFKEMIIAAKPGRPFAYTTKDTVRSQRTIWHPPALKWDGISTQEFVRNVVLQILLRPIPDDEDLFQYGCDRPRGFETSSFAHYGIQPSSIPPNLGQLRLLQSDFPGGCYAQDGAEVFKEFSAIFEKQSCASTLEAGKTVLVTGTTRGFGCHVLANLVLDETVKHIYVVNRPGAVPVMKRQQLTFAHHGLGVNIGKATVLEADLSVETRVLDQVTNSVTHIIHIDAAEDHPLAEAPVNAAVAQGTGYGASKWVSEELLRLAPSLRYLAVHIGQLTGGPRGTWKIEELVPSMIQSSTVLGCLPDDDKFVSWLPVHIAAQLLVDRIDISAPILHLAHLKPVTWSTLARFVSHELNVKLVPYANWLEALENSALNATALSAMRLLPHYKQGARIVGLRNREAFRLPHMSMTSIQEARIPPLDENEVRNWVEYWREAKMRN